MTEFLAKNLSKQETYSLLTQSIIPRPIGFISSISKSGTNNLAPFSFFNAICSFPAYFSVSVSLNSEGKLKDTARNLLTRKEAVFNLVSYDLVNKMNLTAQEFAPEVDEFSESNLTPTPSQTVKPQRVAEALISLESKVKKAFLLGKNIKEISLKAGANNASDNTFNLAKLEKKKLTPGNAVVFFCQVSNFVFQDQVINKKTLLIDQAKLNAVARCGQQFYNKVSSDNIFPLDRP